MKILVITVLMIGGLMSLSLGIDILQGFDMHTALYNSLSAFRIMEIPELFTAFLFIFVLVIQSIVLFYQKKKQAKEPQKQPQP